MASERAVDEVGWLTPSLLAAAMATDKALAALDDAAGTEPDYEALGYPETEWSRPGEFALDTWVDRLLGGLRHAGLDWYRSTDNELRDDVDYR